MMQDGYCTGCIYGGRHRCRARRRAGRGRVSRWCLVEVAERDVPEGRQDALLYVPAGAWEGKMPAERCRLPSW